MPECNHTLSPSMTVEFTSYDLYHVIQCGRDLHGQHLATSRITLMISLCHWEQGSRLCSACCLYRAESTVAEPQSWPWSLVGQFLSDLFQVSKRIALFPFFIGGGIDPSANRYSSVRRNENIHEVFSPSSNFHYPTPYFPSHSLFVEGLSPLLWKMFSMDILFYLFYSTKMFPLFVFWHE